MQQGTFLNGGVALFHTVVEGKHCYEVDTVLTNKPSGFGSKGDKLMMVNDVKTEHVPPKQLVRMLSSGCPLLTLHRGNIDEAEIKCPESAQMKPYHKESSDLSFSLEMVREKCLDEDEKKPQVAGEWEFTESAFDSCSDEEMLLLSMTNTTVAIVEARGCDALNPCSCGGMDCSISGIIVANEQSAVTSVGREYMKKRFERDHIYIQSLLHKSILPENVPSPSKGNPCRTNSATANMTIFYYMSNALDDFDKGVPVVLNFSGSTNFLKCMHLNDRPVLTIECCEKNKLQVICKEDPNTWPFVFYLKTTKDDHRRFESAACSGWFIHTKRSGLVCVDQGTDYNESNFYVIIHLENK